MMAMVDPMLLIDLAFGRSFAAEVVICDDIVE